MFSLRQLNRRGVVTLLVLGGFLYAVRGAGSPEQSWKAAALTVALVVLLVLVKGIVEGILFRRRRP